MFKFDNIENNWFDLVDQLKDLISQPIWENILMNSSKNEAFVLLLLYRQSEVNMSMVANYLNVPLNTATGIITRMEKKGALQRIRSVSDKRVVTIELTEQGKEQIDRMIQMSLNYGKRIMSELTVEELALAEQLFNKVIALMKEEVIETEPKVKKVRKITID